MRRLLLISLLLSLAVVRTAAADVRTIHLKDGVDKTLVYDIAAVDVRLDRSAGLIHTVVRFYRPIPSAFDTPSHWADQVYVDVQGPSQLADDCRYGGVVRGRTSMTASPDRQAPTPEVPEIFSAEARVSYRQEATPLPVVFAPDRLSLTLDVQDDLIKGADLVCVTAGSSGRAAYDPAQPNGGPISETAISGYFKGFSPAAKRRAGFARCAKRYRHNAAKRARCRQRVLAKHPR